MALHFLLRASVKVILYNSCGQLSLLDISEIHWSRIELHPLRIEFLLTDGIFETGACGVPSKSQNPMFWVKVVHLVPNVQALAGHDVAAIHLAPTTTLHFDTVLKTKYSVPYWNFFYFLLK